MNFNEYQKLSKRTIPNEDMRKVSANYALGLAGESGEVGDIIKKWVFHGHNIDRMELKKELGDVLHYLSGLASQHHLELESVAEENIKKLQKRYPNGFNKSDSIRRKDIIE